MTPSPERVKAPILPPYSPGAAGHPLVGWSGFRPPCAVIGPARRRQVEAAKLIERRADPSDRRGVLVRLAPEGKRIVDAAVQAHAMREDELLEALGPADRKRLADLLRLALRVESGT